VVTRQQVVDAYFWFLGREPESEAAIEAHMTARTLDELRLTFMGSHEFANISGLRVENHMPPLRLLPLRVDTEASPEDLRRLVDRIRTEWEHFGATNPHWSVLTEPQFEKASFEANRQWFYDTGAEARDIVVPFCEHLGTQTADFRSCLELGCGVGRVTTQLAKMFPRVIATDISRSHLALCREEVQRRGLHNVELHHLTDPSQIEALPAFAFLYSFMVLQHNPPPVAKQLLRHLLGKMDRGGAGTFQVMTYQAGYQFDLRDCLGNPPPLQMEMHVLPQSTVFDAVADAGCRVVHMREDCFAGLRSRELLSNTFFVRKP
jgi:methylase of polypeptide subunit release factors